MLSVGKNVVECEKNALDKLIQAMDQSFEQAAQLILDHNKRFESGRLIISGMGKSGHIAAKLAATFASTGQPAFFVHPAESGHGDLGMINAHDMLLLLSYSGETKELQPLCDYAKRRNIPMIAITSGKNSSLAKLANVTLLLPKTEEACPMGLAPTSSSTMTLALGDALAVTLLTERGFTRDDFHAFHPSGSLGQQLKRIDSVMHTQIPLVSPDAPVTEAVQTVTQYGFGCVGVVDQQNKLMGIITDGDIRRHAMREGFNQQKAQDIMTANAHTIAPSSLLVEAIAFFEERSISMLFVLDESGKPIGLIHFLDCLRAHAA